MAKPKSIIERFSETVKGLADSASQALKAEEPARVDATTAAYMLFAAEGLVSDPMLVPPIATQPSQRKKRAARKVAGRSTAKAASKTPTRSPTKKSAARKSPRKAEKKSASARSMRITKTAKRGGTRKSARTRGAVRAP